MRKPRTDSTLDFLPDDQREQLMEWILGRVPYRQIVERMEEEYGVQTSIGSISKYWRKWGAEAWRKRREDAVAMATDVVTEARANPGQFSEAAIAELERRAFAMAIDPESSSKELKGIVQILVKREDQAIRKADLELARERLESDREIKLRRLEAMEAKLTEARDKMAKAASLDPAQVADEIDRILGRKA